MIDQPHDQVVIVGRTPTRDDHGRLTPTWFDEIVGSRVVDAEDLTVQVKLTLSGCWHRKAIGGRHTACGAPLGGFASRDESYAGELCDDGCFSRYELHELARGADPEEPGRLGDDGAWYRR